VCAFALILVVATAGSAHATTFFVSTDGNDGNSGSMDSPWQTLRFAVQQLRAGDTLYLRGGVYTGGDNVIDSQAYPVASGSSWGDAITVAGYPGESVTMLPPNFASGIKMTHGSPSYWIFQDFVVDMSNQSYGTGMGATAVYVADGANHIRLLRMEVKNNQGNGVGFSNSNGNSAFNEVINSSIHDNGRFPGVNMGYGLYVDTSDNLIEGNEIYNNGGYGLHFYDNSGAHEVNRNVIRNNHIYGNATHGGTNYGIVIAWGSDNVVDGNTIEGNRGGIQVYTGSSNTLVINNRISGNWPSPGIAMQYYDGAPTVVGNSVGSNAYEIVDFGGNGVPAVESNSVPVTQWFIY